MQSTTTTIFDLPPEIIEMILIYLRLPDLANLAKSSTSCNELAKTYRGIFYVEGKINFTHANFVEVRKLPVDGTYSELIQQFGGLQDKVNRYTEITRNSLTHKEDEANLGRAGISFLIGFCAVFALYYYYYGQFQGGEIVPLAEFGTILGCTFALFTPKRTKIADEYQKICREIPYSSFR